MNHRLLDSRTPRAADVLDVLDELFFVLDEQGRLLEWNSRVREVTGLTDEVLASKRLSALVADGQRRRVAGMLEGVLAGETRTTDLRFSASEGSDVSVRLTAGLREEPELQIYARARLIGNVDEASSEELPPARRFREVLEELPVYVFTQDRDLVYTWVSGESSSDVAGDFIGRTDPELFPPREARRARKVKERVLDTGTPARVELQLTVSGEERTYDVYIAPVRNEAGAVTGLAGASVDITARKEAEERRLASDQQYRKLFEGARDGIVIHRADGQIIDINPAALEILGYTREELKALEPTDVLPYPEQAARGRAMMKEEGEVHNLEVTVRRRDGEEIICLLSSTAQTDESGETERYFTIFRDITERKQYQDQFRLLVDEVEDYAIFMLGPDGQIATWNEGAQKIKGYRPEEIIGEHLSIFYTEAARAEDHADELLAAASREGHIEREEWRVRKDGTRFWARITLTALRDEQGRLRGYAKVTRDLTEQHRREEALRKSEERYRRLFEESQEGIGISTPDGELIDVNPAAQEILGYSGEELHRMRLPELFVDPARREKGREIAVATGTLRNFEARIRRKDGTEIICQLSSTARRGPDGEIEAFQTFFRDVTEAKRAERALRESEEKFRTVAEKALVGIGLVQEGEIQYVNPCYAEIFGYDSEELIGQSPEVFIHPDDRAYVQRQVERRLTGETDSVRYQFKGVTKDGEIRHLDVHGGRITYRDEPAVIATLMDITRQRRLEEQLLEIQEEERRRIGQELHDGIASQLTGVTMIGESLTRRLRDGKEVHSSDLKELTDLVRESAQQTRLLSRGLNPVQVGREGLPAALDQLAERTEKQSGLSCRFLMDGTIREISEQEAAHLYRIAQEAVNNAVKHAGSGFIEVRLRNTKDELELSVIDDGSGIPQELSDEDNGLGLHTMRYRADLIGGQLEIYNRSEGGTHVNCRLPLDGVDPD